MVRVNREVAVAASDGDAVRGDSVEGEDGLRRTPWAYGDRLLLEYYDTEWGLPIRDEIGLLERLSLEAFQSGLSWLTVLRKRPAFRAAFEGFDPEKVAAFGESDVEKLLDDPGIIRNRSKIEATIGNAKATLGLRGSGGLGKLLWSYQPEETPAPATLDEIPTVSPESVACATKLKSLGFRFVGPTTMFALMEAIGMVDTHLVGSHRRGSSGIWA